MGKRIMGVFTDLVRSKLKEYVPQIGDSDDRLYQIATEDLKLYLMYKWNFESHLLESDFTDKFLECVTEEGEDILPLIDLWFSNWIVKWNQRVKIIVKDKDWNVNVNQLSKLIKRGASLLEPKEIEEYKWPIVNTFIEHGEIACVNIIADQIIKREIGKESEVHTWNLERKLQFINMLMKKVVGYISFKGPLVFVKLDKIYFRNV